MSTIHTMQAEDFSPYLQKLNEAKKKKNMAALRSAYENSLSAIKAEEMGLEDTYRKGKNAAAGVSAQQERNFAQHAAANGLGNGAAGQAALARSVTLQNDLNDLETQKAAKQSQLALRRADARGEYENGLAAADAKAEEELAEDIYKEKVRQQELDFDIRKYWYDKGITPTPPVTSGGGGEEGADTPNTDLRQIALQVIRGDWGNGAVRRQKLTAAGYDYNAVQALVDAMLAGR